MSDFFEVNKVYTSSVGLFKPKHIMEHNGNRYAMGVWYSNVVDTTSVRTLMNYEFYSFKELA